MTHDTRSASQSFRRRRKANQVKSVPGHTQRKRLVRNVTFCTSLFLCYCQDKDRTKKFSNTEFDFLGYTFRKVLIKDRLGRLQMNFIASVSKRAEQTLKDKVKSLELHKRSGSKLEMIAESLNPILRGWMNYFGRFNRSAMKRALDCVQRRLIKWAMCKYKNFRGHRRRAEEWLNLVRKREPSMFAHWALGKSS